ncbi:unnamed protein product [Adineta steineri]|uniref:Uncharacterized protein n=1 Tax=Adineta steineri TaxID=433720 RepID=A0A815S9W6_9BILA|nr:unnamed protein product [Adineta steineri]CAF4047648.1 unnamed protein product [Adineta steineri]
MNRGSVRFWFGSTQLGSTRDNNRDCGLNSGRCKGPNSWLKKGICIGINAITVEPTSNAKVEVSSYDGNLRIDVLIDWIGELERYFEYENVWDPN